MTRSDLGARPASFIFARRLPAAIVAIAALAALAAAQQARRPLTHQDYDQWRSIQAQQLSRDGRFLAYALVPQDGDGEIVVRNLATGAEWRQPRGSRPEPPPPSADGPPPAGPPGFGAPAAAQLAFTADARFLVYTIYPTKEEVRAARKAKKKPEEMPKNALGLLDLASGTVARIDRVKRFQVPEDGTGHIAYLLEPKPEAKPPAAAPEEKKPETSSPRRDPKKKEYGSDLVLRSLQGGVERTFADALDFTLSRDARHLVYTVSARDEQSNGVYVVAPAGAAAPVALLAGRGKYQRLTWDEEQTQLAFLSDRDDAASKQPRAKLYYWDRRAPRAVELISESTPGFRRGMVLSDRATLSFSLDGGRLFFGLAPPPEPEPEEDGEIPVEERVVADLWHWKDDYIQPMQKVRAEQDRQRSYRAVYHLKEKKLVALADETMESITPSNDGRWALGSDDRAYRRLVGVDTSYADLYLVDTLSGTRRQLRQKHQSSLSFSPLGKYAVFFDQGNYHSVSIPDGKIVNLTGQLGVKFSQEDHDTPNAPFPYGLGGWTKDDRHLLIYDRYDIWQIAPDGSSSHNLTDGVGRREKIEFRYVKLDPKERAIDPARPLLLRAEVEATRASGFYRDRIGGAQPEKLLLADKNYSNPLKARDADVLLLTGSRFDEYPDLLVTGPDFRSLRKVSAAGRQMEGFLWGRAELVRFKNTDGVPLSGILIKPANFDPQRKYPLLVYIYEQLSSGLHRFVAPGPGTSINPSYYASNGYLVFMPDIVYTIGYPGQSALKCVLPGIQAVVDQGFVDERAIGIQGHSWGGYQIAYMVTQTDRFRAAAPGALVANMTSAYSGIRWGTGLPRQFQYERTQSRIGGSLWEYPLRFLENSPVFRADRVRTPILMLHNDADDAVPWYQGIEFFLALRRLEKEVYLFNYNGELHGLRRRANQKDYTRRLQEFFDHKLKGAPQPAWMERGIRFIDREKEKERSRPAAKVEASRAAGQN